MTVDTLRWAVHIRLTASELIQTMLLDLKEDQARSHSHCSDPVDAVPDIPRIGPAPEIVVRSSPMHSNETRNLLA